MTILLDHLVYTIKYSLVLEYKKRITFRIMVYVRAILSICTLLIVISKKVFSTLLFNFTDENDVVSNYFMKKEKRKGLLAVFNGLKESVLPTRSKKTF